MAFDERGWSRASLSQVGFLALHSYLTKENHSSANDGVAEIIADNYFASKAAILNVHDIIVVKCKDGYIFINVTELDIAAKTVKTAITIFLTQVPAP